MSLEDPRWPWVVPVVAGAVVVLLLWWARRPRRTPDRAGLLVAGTAELRTLPRYRRLVRRHRAIGLVLTVGALLVVAGATVALARPQVVETLPRHAKSRDVMLCLDASASMDADNLAVVRAMQRVVDGLRGDRVGLVIWSGSALLVFPLTDDYDYARAQLARAEAAFDGDPAGFFSGLDATARGASLIGDGIVSCVNRFDRPSEQRTRAIIVSSDNEPLGPTVYPLAEAAAYAVEQDVLVYGVGAGALTSPTRAAARDEFATATAATGGTLVLVGADGAADELIDRIDDLERARASEPPRQVSHDEPRVGLRIAAAGIGVLVASWVLEVAARPRRRRAAS